MNAQLQPQRVSRPRLLQAQIALAADLLRDTPKRCPRPAIGAFDDRGRALYAYPEIAGYWLRWASQRPTQAAQPASRLIAWLMALDPGNGFWPTRIPLQGVEACDNYCHAHYLFDHAMLLDGVQRWARISGELAARRLQAKVVDALALLATQIIDRHGALAAAGVGPLAPRWSGRCGPFLLKACARLRHTDNALAAAAERALPGLIDLTFQQPHAEAHPQLYAIEGLFELGRHEHARLAFSRLIQRSHGLSTLREHTDHGVLRFDVLAQALRLSHLLQMPYTDADAAAEQLASAVTANGQLPFAPLSSTFPRWAALFAEQALDLCLSGPDRALELI